MDLLLKKNIPFLLAVFLCIFSSSSFSFGARAPLGEPLAAAQAQSALDKLRKAQDGVDSMLARVRQTKKSPLLDKAMVTEGIMLLKRPNLLRWEVERPQKIVIVVDGEAMWVYKPSKREATKRLLANDITARYTVGFLASAMRLSMDEMSKNFKADVYQSGDETMVSLQPKSKIVSGFLKAARISYGADGLPQWFEIEMNDGSDIRTEFEDVRVNALKNGDPFILKLPQGTVVTTLGEEEVR